jgi:hypothetical protein
MDVLLWSHRLRAETVAGRTGRVDLFPTYARRQVLDLYEQSERPIAVHHWFN